MAPIYPIPVGRSSDILLSRRLLSQLQSEQRRMLTVQQQLSTGRRIQLSSEDPSSASRAVSVQRMLEVKRQLSANLSTGQSFLDATDTALGGVAGLLADARGLAVRAADSTTSDLERRAMALEIEATTRQMLDIGNQSFRGRYLFAGSESTTLPFETHDNFIAYLGNDTTLRSYSSQGVLFDTNVPGQELFGAVSAEVRGIDLNPNLTAQTRLADLRAGGGIREGNLVISDGTNTSTISIAGAETLSDIVGLIESNPPVGRTIQVTIGSQGLQLQMDAAGGGSFTIRDEVGGTTAAELGIRRTSGSAAVPIQGADLDPILRSTTRLDDVLGAPATPWDRSAGIQISNGGETYVVDLQGAETVEDLLNVLNASGAMVLAEINTLQNGINVRSRLSGADFAIGENGGSTATDLGIRSFTRETPLAQLNRGRGVDVADGVDFTIHRSDGVDLEIDISSAVTVGDVIDLINNHPDNLDPATAVVAQVAAFGNGLELANDNPAGVQPLTVSRSALSFAAWDLGLVARGEMVGAPGGTPAQPASAEIAFAAPNDVNTALQLVANQAGTQWNGIDVEFRNTLAGDVAVATLDVVGGRLYIDMADGQTTANTIVAAITAEGTFTASLDLSNDPTNDGTGTVVAPAGTAATTAGGTAETVTTADVNPLETEGVFNSLIRLRDAIERFDVPEIERLVEMFDEDFDRLNFGRAAVGAHGQSLDAMQFRNEDEQIELHAVLSEEIDVDLAQAASDFAARQAAYEASLRSMASLYRLSLLDFL